MIASVVTGIRDLRPGAAADSAERGTTMALSIQEYVTRLRALHQQVNVRSSPDGHVPVVSEQEWAEVLDYAFQVVPNLEPHWREVGAWVADMMALLDAYHLLASEFLEEKAGFFICSCSPETSTDRGLPTVGIGK